MQVSVYSGCLKLLGPLGQGSTRVAIVLFYTKTMPEGSRETRSMYESS